MCRWLLGFMVVGGLCACTSPTGQEIADVAPEGVDATTDAVASDAEAAEIVAQDVTANDTSSAELDTPADEKDAACSCGDGTCDAACGETVQTCSADCTHCGDAKCEGGESPLTCPVDCCGVCGDGKCQGGLCKETPDLCPNDCATACGNGVCDKGETPGNCAADCLTEICGNGVCEPSDGGPIGCPVDCATPCGDCVCGKGEDASSCPVDCGFCGDGTCSACGAAKESAVSCPADCTVTCGSCDDGVACTVDICTSAGTCAHTPNSAQCSDGDPCTLDTCEVTGCVNGSDPSACSDANPCTDDLCSATSGCAHTFNTSGCSDGDVCTVGDVCVNGVCVGSGSCPDTVEDTSSDAPDVSDSGADSAADVGSDAVSCLCGDGTCVPACGETAATCPGDCLACGDGICAPGESPSACFVDCCGTCGDGKCKGYDCGESSKLCPTDCGTACGDGICDKGESPGICPIDCKVGACGNGVCEPADGGPALCPNDCGTACGNCLCDKGEDFLTCPVDCGWCGDGVCSPCSGLDETYGSCPKDCPAPNCAGGCDDGVACTTDTCASDGVCAHLPNLALCVDNNACTDDLCNVLSGCTNPWNASPCSDGAPCTQGDTCWQGVCTGSGTCPDVVVSDSVDDADAGGSAEVVGTDVSEADVDAGHGDAADADATCTSVCGDGTCACDEDALKCASDCAACGDGVCSPGEGPEACPVDCCGGCGDGKCKGYACGESPTTCPVDCGNACGNLICNKGENPTTCPEDCLHEVCGNGVCEPSDGGPSGCPNDCAQACGNCICEGAEDWLTCPVDCGWCGDLICSNCPALNEKSGGCPVDCGSQCPGGCSDGIACTTDLCTGPWTCTHTADPTFCPDGDACTVDACDPKQGCEHAAYSCNDANPCTQDACDGIGGCPHVPVDGTCDDGDPCTEGDTCLSATCVAQSKNCDDGSTCTQDACVGGGCIHSGGCDLDLVFPYVIDLPGGVTEFTFAAVAGQRISFEEKDTFSLCGVWVQIVGPQGVVGGGGCFNGTGFVDTLTLPMTGTYTLHISATNPEMGSGIVYLHAVPPDAVGVLTPDGPALTLVTTVPGQNMHFQFPGGPGKSYIALVQSSLGLCQLAVSVVGPDDATVTKTGCFFYDVVIDRVPCPETGTYNYWLDLMGAAIGTATVQLWTVPPDLKAPIWADGVTRSFGPNAYGQNVELSHEGKAGDRVGLLTSLPMGQCDVQMVVSDPSGVALQSSGCAGGTQFTDVLTLTQDGTLRVTINPNGLTAAQIEATLYLVPPDLTSPVQADEVPTALTNTVPGQNMAFTFEGQAGARIAIASATEFGQCAFSLTVRDPQGNVLFNHDCFGGAAFTDVITLPTTGTYTIFANPHGIDVGTETIRLYSVAPDVTVPVLPDGIPHTFVNTDEAQNVRLLYAASAGDRIAVHTKTLISQCELALYLLQPSGAVQYASGCFGGDAFTELLTLPVEGTYTVLLDPAGLNVKDVTVEVYAVPANQKASIAIGGPPVSVSIQEIGQNAELSLEALAGQRFYFMTDTTLSQCGLTQTFRSPEGTPIWATGCAGVGFQFDTYTIPADGTYSFVIDPPGLTLGTVTEQLISVPPDLTGKLVRDGPPVQAALLNLGQNAVFTLDVTAGEGIKILLNSEFGACSLIARIRDPNGTDLAASGCMGGTVTLGVPNTAMSGTYTVVLDPPGTLTGNVQVQAVTP